MQWTDFPIFDSLNFPSEFDATDTLAGILLVNKPLGWTSFDVVKYVRSRIQRKKVGHAGTLDPMADGLLVLCWVLGNTLCVPGTILFLKFQSYGFWVRGIFV